MKMRIIFKSGADVTLDVTEFTIGKNGFGNLRSLQWSYKDAAVAMKYVDIGEIACIVRIYEEDAEAAGGSESTTALETRLEAVDGG
jgi:hypothetical protein